SVPLKVPLADEEAKTMLSVYAEGVRDADAMLRELTEYFDSREEPVVLLFFGDHLPNLGDNFAAYRALGIPIGEGESIATTLFTYETPYVLWVNEAAAEVCDVHALTLPDDNTVNANYLGTILLELTGREKGNSYFAFLSALRQKLPLYRNGVGRTGAGEYFDALPAAYEEDLRMLRFWEYYKLKYE
ncbi:MAG: sulfatase-like hydrolase/transferase, partial [bacterium]